MNFKDFFSVAVPFYIVDAAKPRPFCLSIFFTICKDGRLLILDWFIAALAANLAKRANIAKKLNRMFVPTAFPAMKKRPTNCGRNCAYEVARYVQYSLDLLSAVCRVSLRNRRRL